MDLKQKVLLAVAISALCSLGGLIVFGDNGLTDLRGLREERNTVIRSIEGLSRENLTLYREIERMGHDPTYLENVARQQLGFVAKDEIVIKLEEGNRKTP